MNRSHRILLATSIACAVALTSLVASAAEKTTKSAAAPKASSKPASKPASKSISTGPSAKDMAALGLPDYHEPAAYSVDLVIAGGEVDQPLTMKRSIDHGRTRTEFALEDQNMVMIEMGDEKGTIITLMPGEKRAMKMSRSAMKGMAPEAMAQAEEAGKNGPEAIDAKVEDLGDETVDGRVLKKVKMTTDQGTSLGWFEKTTGAPVKMEAQVEGKTSTIEWQNYQVGPQPAKQFEVPKDYEVVDMDEMMSQMKGMGLGGLGGAAGGMAGMAGSMGMSYGKGMAAGMGQNMGQSMGAGLGSALGASLGGPLGAMAGQYIGGAIGGAIGKKAVNTVIGE